MSHDKTSLPPEPTYAPPMTINVLRQGVNVAVRQVLAFSGLGLIALSVPVGFATPFLPVGLPMAVVGAVLLGRNAVWGRRWMESVLTRYPRIEKMAPNWLMTRVFGREKRVFAD
jgi:drug/metabolite transporter (DMT)-like permease